MKGASPVREGAVGKGLSPEPPEVSGRPEERKQYLVGVMLTTFGTFWLGEGFGVEWLLSDAFLLILIAIYLSASFLLVVWLKQVKKQQRAQAIEDQSTPTTVQTQEVNP